MSENRPKHFEEPAIAKPPIHDQTPDQLLQWVKDRLMFGSLEDAFRKLHEFPIQMKQQAVREIIETGHTLSILERMSSFPPDERLDLFVECSKQLHGSYEEEYFFGALPKEMIPDVVNKLILSGNIGLVAEYLKRFWLILNQSLPETWAIACIENRFADSVASNLIAFPFEARDRLARACIAAGGALGVARNIYDVPQASQESIALELMKAHMTSELAIHLHDFGIVSASLAEKLIEEGYVASVIENLDKLPREIRMDFVRDALKDGKNGDVVGSIIDILPMDERVRIALSVINNGGAKGVADNFFTIPDPPVALVEGLIENNRAAFVAQKVLSTYPEEERIRLAFLCIEHQNGARFFSQHLDTVPALVRETFARTCIEKGFANQVPYGFQHLPVPTRIVLARECLKAGAFIAVSENLEELGSLPTDIVNFFIQEDARSTLLEHLHLIPNFSVELCDYLRSSFEFLIHSHIQRLAFADAEKIIEKMPESVQRQFEKFIRSMLTSPGSFLNVGLLLNKQRKDGNWLAAQKLLSLAQRVNVSVVLTKEEEKQILEKAEHEQQERESDSPKRERYAHIELSKEIADFYVEVTLEGMLAHFKEKKLEPFKSPFLPEDAPRVFTKELPFKGKVAMFEFERAIFDRIKQTLSWVKQYLVKAVGSELRHQMTNYGVLNADVPEDIELFLTTATDEQIRLFLTAAKERFKEIGWPSSSFGGPAWAKIAEHALTLWKPLTNAEMIMTLDHVFQLEHNTGMVFDKDIANVTFDKRREKAILDLKFKAVDIGGLTRGLDELITDANFSSTVAARLKKLEALKRYKVQDVGSES